MHPPDSSPPPAPSPATTRTFTGRIEWQCLDCGDHGVKVTGHPALNERAWQSALNDHNLRNPGCDGGMDALRCREETDDDRDAKLRAGQSRSPSVRRASAAARD